MTPTSSAHRRPRFTPNSPVREIVRSDRCQKTTVGAPAHLDAFVARGDDTSALPALSGHW
jgi:hypothetical protein